MSTPLRKKQPHPRPGCVDCATRWNCVVGGLDLDDLALASPLIRECTFRRGTELSSQGVLPSSIKIIKLGTLITYRGARGQPRRPIEIAGRGAVFGMYGYFGHPNPVSAVAVSEGRYCEISLRHLQEEPRWGDAFRQRLLARCALAFGMTADWSAAVRLGTLIQQLGQTLLLLSEVQVSPVIQLPTHTALAELLGTTRESVARGLSTLASENCISKLERRKCHVYGKRLREWLDSA